MEWLLKNFYGEEIINGNIIISYSDILFESSVVQRLLDSDHDISVVVDIDWRGYYVGRKDHPITEAENIIFNSNNEVEKIKALFLNKKIEPKKLNSLINNTYNLDFDNLRDSCLDGDKKKLNENLGNIILQNEHIYFYLGSLNSRIQKLLQLQNQYKIDKNMDVALENIKPKIFWKDKPIFLKQIKKWNIKKLEIAKRIIINTG